MVVFELTISITGFGRLCLPLLTKLKQVCSHDLQGRTQQVLSVVRASKKRASLSSKVRPVTSVPSVVSYSERHQKLHLSFDQLGDLVVGSLTRIAFLAATSSVGSPLQRKPVGNRDQLFGNCSFGLIRVSWLVDL